MLKILKDLGLSEEMAEKVLAVFEDYLKEKEEEEKAGEKSAEEEKAEENPKKEIAPMGKADEIIPTKEEFEKMGYLARIELKKSNPKLYETLKKGI